MKLVRFATLMLAVVLWPLASFGQGRGGGSSSGSGGFGGGSTFGASGSGGNSGFGGSSFGSGGMGGSGFGGGGFGSGGMGGGGFGGQGGGMGAPGAQMGMNFGDNQSFIGSDSAQIRQSLQQMGRNSDRMTQSIDRATSRRRDRDNDSQGNQAPPVRVRLKVAFEHPPIGSAAVPAAITQRLTKIVAAKELAMPDLDFRDGVVTLSGVVPTASDRLLIEKLVSLEPGVKQVVNQMTVPPATAAPTAPQ